MAAFNKLVLVGNLTKDPDLRYTPGGMPVAELRLAVNEKSKTANGEWIETPLFIGVTLWGKVAEVADEYLAKGSSVLIEGRLKLDEWEDQKTREKRSQIRVVGETMQMLGGPSREGNQERRETQTEYSQERPKKRSYRR